jgi:membrane protein DedA with SNARE-associated domain/rhodanese-related sulfurtransferase
MTQTSQFLIQHGLPLVFVAVFVEQMGLPLPALPWLLAAGALSASSRFSLPLGLMLTVIACLVADTFWFYLGRYRGSRVLGLLCRISLEPDSCVRRTQNVFTRYGPRGLLVVKFLPGLNTVAPPLAGMSGMGAGRFLLLDGVGSLLYGGVLLGLGYVFSSQIEQIGAAVGRIGGSALRLMAGMLALYVAYKYWQRQRLLRELRLARITVDELRGKLEAGENPVILDLRSRNELEQDPSVIPGAIHLGLDEIEERHPEFPRDRDIVVYCSCPNEVTSARVALALRRKGFSRVRPLLGGIDAWRGQQYPMGSWRLAVASASAVVSPTFHGVTATTAATPTPVPASHGRTPAEDRHQESTEPVPGASSDSVTQTR